METNSQLDLAFNFIQYTGNNLFLTGKAGTGKTTFLRNLKALSPKRMVVTAPTGVAAINAGGVTLHSFFQLPFGPYIPGGTSEEPQQPALKRHVNKFSKEKINILRSLDLLVIDEISMVRADILDAVSDVLRRFKDRNKPFGGVQLLLIGDLQQLAPVVKDDEWELLREHYSSVYFFESKALKESTYRCIELTKVYRQADEAFITLLNRIRDNKVDASVLARLNERYLPGFRPASDDGYITLTTHNYIAQQINNSRLAELPGRIYTFLAKTEGEFPAFSFPTDEQLQLKNGAQVMFVKNDSSGNHRYFNGKIGIVTWLDVDRIRVRCAGETEEITVEREEWKNVKYTIDKATREITETVEGTFSQYPLKTAWAITIHKSQGLTFEKAIIDASAAFSHGQVYVALSRCKTLEGIVLSSPIRLSSVIKDDMVQSFADYVEQHQPDNRQFCLARKQYYLALLADLFDYDGILRNLAYVSRLYYEHLHRLYPELAARYGEAVPVCREHLSQVGVRFRNQLQRMAEESVACESDAAIRERVVKGVVYFREKIAEILSPLAESEDPEIDNKEVRKTIEKALQSFRRDVTVKMQLLEVCADGFDMQVYLSARARATVELPKQKAKKEPQEKKTEVAADIVHPELYEALRRWRNERAAEAGLPPYVILQQKALLGIANTLPSGSKELLAVPGVGKKVIEKYGVRLLEIVDRYRFGEGGSF